MVIKILRIAALLCPVSMALVGCVGNSPPPIVEAKGVVKINDQPLSKAQVKFIPEIPFGPEYIAVGVTDENGRFKLTCNGQSWACACLNKVTITEQEIPDELLAETAQGKLKKYLDSLKNRPIPKLYGSLAKTPLKADVTADQNQYDFNLKR